MHDCRRHVITILIGIATSISTITTTVAIIIIIMAASSSSTQGVLGYDLMDVGFTEERTDGQPLGGPSSQQQDPLPTFDELS